jgi:hypothetical protein
MQDPKGLELFQEVLSKTKAGRIKWQPAASESEYFAVLPGGFTLTVVDSASQDSWTSESSGLRLALRDDDRELLEVTVSTDGVTWAELNELFQSAKRQALRVDEKVDKLLGVLTKL